MKVLEIIEGFHKGLDIYPETIALIRGGNDDRREFVNYFVRNKDGAFAKALVHKFIEIRKQSIVLHKLESTGQIICFN